MILTCHLLAGAAIASKISNPIIALPLAFLSHYFLDLLPHKDYSIAIIRQRRWSGSFSDFSKVFIDIFFGIFLIWLSSSNNATIYFASFLVLVPDGITLLSIISPDNKLLAQHQKIHKALNSIGDAEANKKIPAFLGFLTQALVIIITTYLL